MNRFAAWAGSESHHASTAESICPPCPPGQNGLGDKFYCNNIVINQSVNCRAPLVPSVPRANNDGVDGNEEIWNDTGWTKEEMAEILALLPDRPPAPEITFEQAMELARQWQIHHPGR
ncbi:MAG: hypothetical protein HQL37_15825 [Alphaproteobacteria bacterium]|nr:hypothetical protein [Alphaproteobacteria bacterium]